MSSIFGIFRRNGENVSAEAFSAWQDAMDYWQPDATGAWVEGTVGLGHLMLWNTPELKFDALPRVHDDETGPLVITADVRLDNRSSLYEVLKGLPQLADRPLNSITDTELLLAAYQQWGVDCAQELLGDFAFVIWDKARQRLFCARDHVGVKQFYFYLTGSLLVFANDLKGLAQHPDVPTASNDAAVANFLVHGYQPDAEVTFFAAIQRLPPAHTLVVTGDAVEMDCYWRPEDAPRVDLPDAEACAGALRELLEQAVHARLRSDYPVTSHLSGGLDSTAIAVVAARKLAEKGEKLLAFNWVQSPSGSDNASDREWSSSKAIAGAEGIEHHYVDVTVDDIYQQLCNQNMAYGNKAVFYYEDLVRDAVHQKGSRTILSGWGGDELATYHGRAFCSDLLLSGRLIKVFAELRAQVKKSGRGLRAWPGTIYARLVLPLVPRWLYCRMPKVRCARLAFRFVHPTALPLVKKQLRAQPLLTTQPSTTIRKHMLDLWRSGYIACRIESWAAAAIEKRLEYAYPLLDKRIVEFVLGVPAEYFVSAGVGRHLFRTAVKGIIPESILWSDMKRDQHRVNHTLALMPVVYKRMAVSEKIANGDSEWVERASLIYELQNFSLAASQAEVIEVLVGCQVAILVLQSLPVGETEN